MPAECQTAASEEIVLFSAAPRVNQFCSIITIALTLGCNGERREDDSLAAGFARHRGVYMCEHVRARGEGSRGVSRRCNNHCLRIVAASTSLLIA